VGSGRFREFLYAKNLFEAMVIFIPFKIEAGESGMIVKNPEWKKKTPSLYNLWLNVTVFKHINLV